MLVIFDADGTLTPQRATSRTPFEHRLLPGVAEKCSTLRADGYTLAVASNQGGARREKNPRLSFGYVLNFLRWLQRELGLAACKFATRPPRKKPSPAMLNELMAELGFTPDQTIFVGDQESDREAAQAAGVSFQWATDFFRGE